MRTAAATMPGVDAVQLQGPGVLVGSKRIRSIVSSLRSSSAREVIISET